jgi:hypothetical protein
MRVFAHRAGFLTVIGHSGDSSPSTGRMFATSIGLATAPSRSARVCR